MCFPPISTSTEQDPTTNNYLAEGLQEWSWLIPLITLVPLKNYHRAYSWRKWNQWINHLLSIYSWKTEREFFSRKKLVEWWKPTNQSINEIGNGTNYLMVSTLLVGVWIFPLAMDFCPEQGIGYNQYNVDCLCVVL